MPVTVPTAKNIALGEGAFYLNYSSETTPPVNSNIIVGATRGGSFNREVEYKDLEFDGKRSAVKGFKRKIGAGCSLVINTLEIVDAERVAKFYAGLQVDSTNAEYDVVTAKKQIDDTDYLTNVAWVGETLAGEEVVIIVHNALGDGTLELALEDKEEVVPEVTFTGHSLPSDIAAEPWEIRYPKATA